MVSSTECVGIEMTLKYFAEDKGNKNNWLYPRCLEALKSKFEMDTLFHISRTFNIMNLQFKWLQEFLDIDFPEAGIIRGRDYRAQHIFYLPETPQTPFLNCPIDSLAHQGSQFGVKRFFLAGHVMRNPLVSNHWLGTHICAHFVLVPLEFLLWIPERLQMYVLSPHLTSPALTSNVSFTWVPTSAADTILLPAITSGARDTTDEWQCDPWFKTQVKAVASEFAVYKMMN